MRPNSVRAFIIAVPVLALIAGIAASAAGSGSDLFMPHAHCYLFNRGLMMLHGWSDLFIGLSYVSISTTLTYLVLRSRRELPFHWMMLAFALFIVACGVTHFMELWTLQAPQPRYWLAGWMKLLTAAASVVVALLLPPLVPKIRAVLQSARLGAARKAELEKAYAELSELYQRATGAAPETASAAAPRSFVPTEQEAAEPARDLAHMAKEVSVHARELERAKDVAEAANRAKDQFLAALSHELRTPLTPALAAATDLESAVDLGRQELSESLAVIRRNIAIEARLVDDLLDTTRIGKGKLELHLATIDLHEPIRHAVEMSRSVSSGLRAEVVLQLEAADRHVLGDDARLAQVFWNLTLNAVKFTPPDGRVTVCTSNPAPGTVRVEVTDTGLGIAPGMLAEIFEPFHQGESSNGRRFGGVGLGLTIAKGLVEAHGGRIAAQSDGKGCGAKFIVDLQTVDAKATPAVSPAAASAPPAHRGSRILLVEDHDDTRCVLTRALTRRGHVVEAAATIAEAVQIAPGFDPELLLSDLGLPDGTGMDLLGRMRKRRPIPAIAMSGYGMESDLEQTRHAGFDVHLIKPISVEELNEAIDRLMAG